jgi:hypothetical protein
MDNPRATAWSSTGVFPMEKRHHLSMPESRYGKA